MVYLRSSSSCSSSGLRFHLKVTELLVHCRRHFVVSSVVCNWRMTTAVDSMHFRRCILFRCISLKWFRAAHSMRLPKHLVLKGNLAIFGFCVCIHIGLFKWMYSDVGIHWILFRACISYFKKDSKDLNLLIKRFGRFSSSLFVLEVVRCASDVFLEFFAF